jgi:D-3-phosphoglycerate dehydrogenase
MNEASLRVLVSDSVSEQGIELLRSTPGVEVTVRTGLPPAELAAEIARHDALIVRSATRVTADLLRHPGRLRVIGRAGTGVDNIDLDAATAAGVVVINTPGGNSVAAAEHTFSLLLALARSVPQANHDLRAGRWERKKYVGVEVAGKTLGIVGLGRIGREVARRALGFRMTVLGYDPFVSSQAAADIGARAVELDLLVAESDFVTLHMPASADTAHLVDAALLARFKPGARLINCARGGLVDEAALLAALDSGHLAGAALDVFEREPPEDRRLIEHPHVVATPHLGASTLEAQERVGTEIAVKIRDYLQSGVMLDAVNFPPIGREEYARLRPLMDLGASLGSFVAQIAEGGVRALKVETLGTFSEHPLRPLAMAGFVRQRRRARRRARDPDRGNPQQRALALRRAPAADADHRPWRGVRVGHAVRARPRAPRRSGRRGDRVRPDGAPAVPAQPRRAGGRGPHRHAARRRRGEHRRHPPGPHAQWGRRGVDHPPRRRGAAARARPPAGAR